MKAVNSRTVKIRTLKSARSHHLARQVKNQAPCRRNQHLLHPILKQSQKAMKMKHSIRKLHLQLNQIKHNQVLLNKTKKKVPLTLNQHFSRRQVHRNLCLDKILRNRQLVELFPKNLLCSQNQKTTENLFSLAPHRRFQRTVILLKEQQPRSQLVNLVKAYLDNQLIQQPTIKTLRQLVFLVNHYSNKIINHKNKMLKNCHYLQMLLKISNSQHQRTLIYLEIQAIQPNHSETHHPEYSTNQKLKITPQHQHNLHLYLVNSNQQQALHFSEPELSQ